MLIGKLFPYFNLKEKDEECGFFISIDKNWFFR